MLNNVKNFVISKKEAFKVGCGPTKVKNVVTSSLIGGVCGLTIVLMISMIGAVIAAIRIGERMNDQKR